MSDNKKNCFNDGSNFYILGNFTEELNEHIIVPFTKKISELSKINNSSITFHINSYGGDSYICHHLVTLFEFAKSKNITIKTIVPCIAFSAGSILAIAASNGERYISRTSEHLIHYGEFDGWRKRHPLQIERSGEFWKRYNKNMINHYNKYCKIPKLEEHLKHDDFFVEAKKCIEWKIADKYIEDYQL